MEPLHFEFDKAHSQLQGSPGKTLITAATSIYRACTDMWLDDWPCALLVAMGFHSYCSNKEE